MSTPLTHTSNPAIDALKAIGITTMEQLAKHTEKEIASTHGVGPKSIRIWKAELKKLGLGFQK